MIPLYLVDLNVGNPDQNRATVYGVLRRPANIHEDPPKVKNLTKIYWRV